MKYADYYAALGVERDASPEAIKKAYRRLAQKHHPDVSKEPGAEARFKEIAEAYQTLKDPEKRAAYDALGSRPQGEEFRPPPDWARQHGGGGGEQFSFDDVDFSDLFSRFGSRGAAGGGSFAGRDGALPGQDFEVPVEISIEDAFRGTTLSLSLSMPEYDGTGRLRRVPHTVNARVAPGAVDGQRLRLPRKGGKGFNGGRDGDLYLDITLKPHPLYRATGHDLYLDLPLAPWEAALGASVEVPTLAGAVSLKVPAGTSSGRKLRLAGRGLPKARGGAGDLFAVAQIVVPAELSERERDLYGQLGEAAASSARDASAFDPRRHFDKEGA
jgi:curved DNA-binding protein